MAKEISTSIHINASPKRIWEVLTETHNYSNWNPFIKYIKGNLKIDEKIEVLITPPKGKKMIFKPILKSVIVNKEITWQGKLLFKGLFDGQHTFKIQDNGDDTSIFVHSEKFKGILVPFLGKMIEGSTKEGFTLMNNAMKTICENND